MRALPAVLLCAFLAGCAGDDTPEPRPAPREPTAGAERVIRGWVGAVARRDYDRAAGFFARGAVVDQGTPIRLPDRRAAVAFNRSLPCKAKLTRVEPARGGRVLGSFSLSAGRPGTEDACDGEARVRFTIRRGRFTEWRQLPGAPPAMGQPV